MSEPVRDPVTDLGTDLGTDPVSEPGSESVTWLLRPGFGIARRDAGHLQVGIDPPLVAVLPDSPAIRRMLVELGSGGPVTPLDESTAPALTKLIGAGLVVPTGEEAARAACRSATVVHLDAPQEVVTPLTRLLSEAGLSHTTRGEEATVALVWRVGELSRERLDGLMRRGMPHLVVRERPDVALLGPYVVPGRTACLRCTDAHLGETDPRRTLVIEQLATATPLRAASPDPGRRALTLAWAVNDLATAANGERPATWSAMVRVDRLPPQATSYRRHPYCGCAWAEGLLDAG